MRVAARTGPSRRQRVEGVEEPNPQWLEVAGVVRQDREAAELCRCGDRHVDESGRVALGRRHVERQDALPVQVQ